MSKIRRWVGHVDVLAGVAVTQPQLAYAALSGSLQHEWNFLLCVVLQCCQLFQELEMSLFSGFFTVMFGTEMSAVERCLFVLPLLLGGLGISNPASLLLICLLLLFMMLSTLLDLLLVLRLLS